MKTIVFAGGGTAGHVMPNLALIAELRHRFNCIYVGGEGMEKELCLKRGIPFYQTPSVKFVRGKIWKNLLIPFRLAACVKSAKRLLAELRPDLVFSKGGYAALPVVLAAKCPVLCHESDCSPGLTTRLCKRKSVKVLCAFEPCSRKLKKGMYVGTPLFPSLYGGAREPSAYGLGGARAILGVVGGSSGAGFLNELTAAALPELTKNFDVIHITGKNKKGSAAAPGYSPVEFEYDMPRFYATCDLIVSRAGANALAECIALRKPTLAVPLERASRGDQLQNADFFAQTGAIMTRREKELTPSNFCTAIAELAARSATLRENMGKLKIDGTAAICKEIYKVLCS